jgi:hypothetical protein
MRASLPLAYRHGAPLLPQLSLSVGVERRVAAVTLNAILGRTGPGPRTGGVARHNRSLRVFEFAKAFSDPVRLGMLRGSK